MDDIVLTRTIRCGSANGMEDSKRIVIEIPQRTPPADCLMSYRYCS